MERKNPVTVRRIAKKGRKKVQRVSKAISLPLVKERKERYAFEGGFVVMGRFSLEEIIAKYSKDLNKESWLVFLVLCARLDLEKNKVVVNQAEIGRRIGLPRQNVQRAIKQLMEAGLIVEGPKEGQSRSYQLDPEVVFRGSAKNHAREIDKHRKQKTKARMKVLQGGKAQGSSAEFVSDPEKKA